MDIKRIAQLVRMLSSQQQGEILIIVEKLNKICNLNDLGNIIENNANGGSNGKLSKEEMSLLYETGLQDGDERGYKRGLEEGKTQARRPSPFEDVLDNTDEQMRVLYVQQRTDKLKTKERDFINSVIHRSTVLNKPLTPGQVRWFNDIYRRLGGK